MLNMRCERLSYLLVLCSGLGCSANSPGNGAGLGGAGRGSYNGSAGGPMINTDPGVPTTETPDCGSILDVTYRDFDESHPDFEMKFMGDVVRRGLVEASLGADRKPVFKDSIGFPALPGTPTGVKTDWQPKDPVIASADSFKQWYNTSEVNREFARQLPLSQTTPGSGIFGYDSTMFFPLTPSEGFGITPKGNGPGMNFLFTTEVHVQFRYAARQVFTFRGDDDLWIFVNGRLALDLGSLHNAEEGTIDFDAQAAALDISVGGRYSMDIFHAERHTFASNFKITTNIACFTPGVVK